MSAQAAGVRYVQHTSAYINSDKAKPLDYYCTKLIDGVRYGFVLPWDAVECFDKIRPKIKNYSGISAEVNESVFPAGHPRACSLVAYCSL